MTLFRKPLQTLSYFCKFSFASIANSSRSASRHPVTLFVVLPLLGMYLIAKQGHHLPELLTSLEVSTLVLNLASWAHSSYCAIMQKSQFNRLPVYQP